MCYSKFVRAPSEYYETRPFASQTKVSFETPSTVVYDKKFDTAIRASHAVQHYERKIKEKLTRDDKLTINLVNYPEKNMDINIQSSMNARVLKKIILGNNKGRKDVKDKTMYDDYARIVNLATMNLQIQNENLNKNNYMHTNVRNRLISTSVKRKLEEHSSLITRLLDFMSWLNAVINMSNNMYSAYYRVQPESDYVNMLSKKNFMIYEPLDLEISWSHNYCVVSYEGYKVLLPKTYILLMHNKVCDFLSVIVYAIAAQGTNLPTTMGQIVIDFVVAMLDICIEHGQDSFAILKCLEGIASGEAIKNHEAWVNDGFISLITKELLEESNFDYHASEIYQIWKPLSDAVRHELACLSKIPGHPFVEMESGSFKIYKYTHEEQHLNYDRINDVMCLMKQNYIRNFIMKEGRWPAHEIIPQYAHKALRYGSLLNKDPEGPDMHSKYGRVPLSEYNHIELGHELRYNTLTNALPHLKDKTISMLRSKVIAKYINHSTEKQSWQDTRLLLFYLFSTDEKTDHTDFIQEFGQGLDIEEFMSYLVMRLVPKEKELKVDFRGFGCTTFHTRLLNLSQEKTMMEYLDLYCDEQAMTISELQLAQRLYSFRNLHKAYPKHRVIHIMVDASKWNNKFRKETVDDIFKHTFDKMYNTKIFGRTQERFENMLFYVPDGSKTYSWDGQNGGIEGQNQDSWVEIYINQIKVAIYGLDYKYHVLCKGDDFRLSIIIPDNDPRINDIMGFKNEIMTRVNRIASELGHDIKILDSYGSEVYFNFSKMASIRSVELSQALRKIQKCYGASNAFLPTLDDYIGATFSNAHSTCHATTNFIPCYFTALFWSYAYLVFDKPPPRSNKNARNRQANEIFKAHLHYSNLSDDELVALLLSPNMVGGFPVIYLHNMMVRAESDLLPGFFDIYSYCCQYYRSVSLCMANMIVFDGSKKETWKPLYMDPYSLPLSRPQTATSMYRNTIYDILEKHTKNSKVRELFDLVHDDFASSQCLKAMDSADKVYAKVFSLLYSAFPEAIIDEILRKFESSRSVAEVIIIRAGWRRNEKALRQALKSDVLLQTWRISRLTGIHDPIMRSYLSCITDCPVETAFNIRRITWGKEVEGITMPPMSHFLYFMPQAAATQHEYFRWNHFQYHIMLPKGFACEEGNFHYGDGSFTPFLGHRTSPGTTSPNFYLVEKDPFLQKLRNIAELASWVCPTKIGPDGEIIAQNIHVLISKLIRLFTNAPLETFAPFAGKRKSGTIAHHVVIRQFRESIMPNSLSNVYQLVRGVSNSHLTFFKSPINYYVNFLQCFCHATCMLTYELNGYPNYTVPEDCAVGTVNCEFCMREVVEDPIVINDRLLDDVVFPQLQMTTINEITIGVLKESLDICRDKRYNVTGHIQDVDLMVASVALFEVMCDTDIHQRDRITSRYTNFPTNQEGIALLSAFVPHPKNSIVGFKELGAMSNEHLAIAVTQIIYNQIMLKLNINSIGSLSASLMNIPANHLPWYSILQSLYTVGRLGDVLNTIAQMGQNLPYHLSQTADQMAPVFGIYAFDAMRYCTTVHPIIILSNFEVPTIQARITYRMSHMLWASFLHEYNLIIRNNNIDIDRQIYLTMEQICTYLVLVYIITHPETQYREDVDYWQLTEVTMDDMLDIDYESPAQIISMEDELYESFCRRYGSSITHATGVTMEKILGEFRDKAELVHDHVYHVARNKKVTVVYTTIEACVDTLRSMPINIINVAEPRHRNPIDDVRFDRFFIPIARGNSMICVIPQFDVDAQDHRDVAVYMDREREEYIRLCYVYRPFGYSNATMNHYRFILECLRYGGMDDWDGLKLHMMGDGLGNATFLLCQLGWNYRVMFTTKPDDFLTRTEPCLMSALENLERGHHIIHEHSRTGGWDLSHQGTFLPLEEEFGAHDLYISEAQRAPNAVNFHKVYIHVLGHYLRSRNNNSILIMHVSLDDLTYISKILAILQHKCLHVFLFQPPSIRCYLHYYIVAWGFREGLNIRYYLDMERYVENQRVPVQLSITLENFLRRRIHSHGRYMNTGPTIDIFHRIPSSILWCKKLPPLWTSLLQKEYNININSACINNIYDDIEDIRDLVKILNHIRLQQITETVTYWYQQIFSRKPPIVTRNIMFSTNHRAHRNIMVRKYLGLCGWIFMEKHIEQGHTTVSNQTVKAHFYWILSSLPLRDFNPEDEYENLYGHLGTGPDGYDHRYWVSFLNGLHIYLTFLSWIKMELGVLRPLREEIELPQLLE